MVLEFDVQITPVVIVAHHLAKFHRDLKNEFVENAVQTLFEEGFGPQLLLKDTDWVNNFKNTIS